MGWQNKLPRNSNMVFSTKGLKLKTKIRTEMPSDFLATEELTKKAFENASHTSGKEWLLVKSLRSSAHFIKELSLVAEDNNQIIGHILFTPIEIKSATGEKFHSLALAPVSVLPEFQGRGIGGQLIEFGHEVAKQLGFKSVILLGHAEYYPRFGYKKASQWNIKAPFEVPDEVFMAIELEVGALNNISGVVEYPPEFNE